MASLNQNYLIFFAHDIRIVRVFCALGLVVGARTLADWIRMSTKHVVANFGTIIADLSEDRNR